MGCDIHTVVEIRKDGRWVLAKLEPPVFDWRSYGMYGFLAGVRNYSMSPEMFVDRGLPPDTDYEFPQGCYYYHHTTWFTLQELLAINYDTVFENRRTSKTVGNFTDGAALAEEGHGTKCTFREFLGDSFFKEIDRLKALGSPENVRVIAAFDN